MYKIYKKYNIINRIIHDKIKTNNIYFDKIKLDLCSVNILFG